MLTVHHLNQSRSQRVLWALEELQLSYQVVCYQREKHAGASGTEKIHPLGKSPVLEDQGVVLAESGAILEYLQETYDSAQQLRPLGREETAISLLAPLCRGSLMPLLLMKLIFASLGKPPVPLGMRTLGGALGKGCKSVAGQTAGDPRGVYRTASGPSAVVCRQCVEYGGYPDELPGDGVTGARRCWRLAAYTALAAAG